MTILIHPGHLNTRVTVGALPNDVLLEVFGFCVDVDVDVDEECDDDDDGDRLHQGRWLTLVHVCRQWRCLVFASPRSLDLRLYCTPDKPVKKMLDIWPELPIVIHSFNRAPQLPGVANIMAALKQPNRVRKIGIDDIPNSLLKILAAEMSTPFPALTDLELFSTGEGTPVLPDSFLGGSAPLLQYLGLCGVPFPALPKLLLTATNLVVLRLEDLPPSGYISPEAIVTSLSALTKLKSFSLGFRSPRSQHDQEGRPPPPVTRVVLPALTEFWFTGDSDYFEDTLSRIDTPLLCDVLITFFNQLAFDTPSLRDFISRTESFKAPHRAHLMFSKLDVTVLLFHRNGVADPRTFQLRISYHPLRWRWGCPTLVQMYNSCFPPFPTLEHLVICENRHSQPEWQDYMQSAQWLELFRSFTSVKCLCLAKDFVAFVSLALVGLIGQQVTEILPALQTILVDGLESSDPTGALHGTMSFVVARYGFGSYVDLLFF